MTRRGLGQSSIRTTILTSRKGRVNKKQTRLKKTGLFFRGCYMPYRKFTFAKDGYYHLYNRGNNFGRVFFERENYLFFLKRLREYLVPDVVDMIAYCLMPNHYHLLIQVKQENLSAVMQAFSLSYSKAVNKKFGRVGSLFQGRFKAIPIAKNEYLLHLSRYIHLNPVAATLVERAEDWEFSSYRDYMGMRQGTLVRPEVVRSQFRDAGAYHEFVEEYQAYQDVLPRDLLFQE